MICLALSGCGSDGSQDWLQLFKAVRASWEGQSSQTTLNAASAIPYATLGLRVGAEPEQIVVLATDTNGQQLWTSAARMAITTRFGRVVATAGLPNNLGAYALHTSVSVWRGVKSFDSTADFPDIGMFAIELHCVDTPVGTESINILGANLATLKVKEKCHSSNMNWEFENTFWVDPTSERVWRSIQYVHPKLAPLTLEILRPPILKAA